MSATVPPSPRRLRAARRAGLRPRSPSLALAGLAFGAWSTLDTLGSRAPAWMGRALGEGLAGGSLPLDPSRAAAALLGAGVVAGVAAFLLAGRVHARRRLGVDPGVTELPAHGVIASRVLGLTIVAAWLRPAIATAARSVDAAGPAGLWIAWTHWLGTGLLALACAAVVLAVIERLASARRLWQGLHLTRAQARDHARAAGDHRRR